MRHLIERDPLLPVPGGIPPFPEQERVVVSDWKACCAEDGNIPLPVTIGEVLSGGVEQFKGTAERLHILRPVETVEGEELLSRVMARPPHTDQMVGGQLPVRIDV